MPCLGGRWFERMRSGQEQSWGDVRAYERGRRIVVGFAIGADRRPAPVERSSEVEFTFSAAESGQTRVSVEHRAFEKHGEQAEALRSGMDSAGGWPAILAEFARETRRSA